MNHRMQSAFASKYRNDQLARESTYILLVILVFLVSATYGCSSAIQLSSAWRDREIVVDGSDSEWKGATAYFKGSNVALGIRNDNDYLYACVIMMDRQMQMQMMASGFTVWFDPEGGKNKAFGIHFPLGTRGQPPPTGIEGGDNRQDPQRLMEQTQRELEILGPGKEDRERIPLMQVQGINVKIGNDQGFLVYELRVPLRKSADHPYAIGTGTGSGQAVGIGFETTELNLEMMKEQMDGMPGGGGGRGGPPMGAGGMPPGGGGPPGGGPRGMGPPGGERAASLKLWTQVQLAPGNTSTAK